MRTPHIHTLSEFRSPLADRLIKDLTSLGLETGEARSIRDADAVLLLASGSLKNETLQRYLQSRDCNVPFRAAVFNDAGALAMSQLGLRDEVVDFRAGFEQAFAILVNWLASAGLIAAGKSSPSRFPEVFISYQLKDRAFAESLRNLLRTIGWEGWIYHGDDRDYNSSSWVKEIDQRIKQAVGMLFVLSPEWLASSNCFSEWTKGERTGKRKLQLVLREFSDTYKISDPQQILVSGPQESWFPHVAKALKSWRG